jgi:hypothetical protein
MRNYFCTQEENEFSMRMYYTLSDYPHEMIELSATNAVVTVGCGLLGCSRSTDLTSNCRTCCGRSRSARSGTA